MAFSPSNYAILGIELCHFRDRIMAYYKCHRQMIKATMRVVRVDNPRFPKLSQTMSATEYTLSSFADKLSESFYAKYRLSTRKWV
jgi:hypothetical protein